MVTKMALRFSLCKSKVHFFRFWSCYVTFINCIINLTVPFYWTFCFFSAIAFRRLVTSLRCDFFYFVPWWILTYYSCNCSWLNLCCIWKCCESLWHLVEKCFVIVWRNVFATSVETDLLKSGLKDIMFWFQNHHIYIYIYVYLYIYISLYIYIYLSVYLSIYLSFYLSIIYIHTIYIHILYI